MLAIRLLLVLFLLPTIYNAFQLHNNRPRTAFRESLNVTGYVNSTVCTESGTIVNEDYTPAFEGNYSLLVDSSAGASYVYCTFPATDPVYEFHTVKFPTWAGASTRNFFVLEQLDGTNLLTLQKQADETIVLICGSVASAASATTFAADTQYCFWTDYAKETGGGGNGVCNFYFAVASGSTCTKPGAAELTVTTGDSAATVERINFVSYVDEDDSLVDEIIVSDSQLGSNPW